MAVYDPKKIEKKWQERWEKDSVSKAEDFSKKSKKYILDMFPYPSGEGLHVGHPLGYVATDVFSRFLRMRGFNVLHPMGWDAFGLPAENFAIKNKIHPRIAVERNIKKFKQQLSLFGFSYDWSREINTTDPNYYKWTQWIFLKLFRRGLAYQAEAPVNFCPKDKTCLANEEVINGRCERCGTLVERRMMKQWFLKITAYAERLLAGLDKLDWPERVKQMQRNWIGRSQGAEIVFKLKSKNEKGKSYDVPVFTTRPDTLFGATYIVLAPEHPAVSEKSDLRLSIANLKEVERYITRAKNKSDLQRQEEGEKTGIKIDGIIAVNPANQEEIPVFVADYVFTHYGTGAIMAVPAHDQRDFEFANNFKLPIKMVVCPNWPEKTCPVLDKAYEGPGYLVGSGSFDGMESAKAGEEITKAVRGKKKIYYKMRDWLFSRQRYWGEPIPVVHCEKCGVVAVSEEDLPVKLPEVESYEPTGTGESPLALIESWVNTTCPSCGGKAKRETDTMPQWAGSSWYYLRYLDPRNQKHFVDAKKEKYWMPVDLYLGGAEHAVLHLLYARFWHKVLFDEGLVSQDEPFQRLFNQGMVLGPDGQKMSKSRGNIINPDDVIKSYGADTIRLYELFMGPLEDQKPWNTEGIIGLWRFLAKVFKLASEVGEMPAGSEDDRHKILRNKTIKKVTEDIESMRFNTAISAMMEYLNEMLKLKALSSVKTSAGGQNPKDAETLVLLLAPFAPHICEEMWREVLRNKDSVHQKSWPVFDLDLLKDESVTIAVQINGKTRGLVSVPKGSGELFVREVVEKDAAFEKYFGATKVKKAVFVPDRIINFVL